MKRHRTQVLSAALVFAALVAGCSHVAKKQSARQPQSESPHFMQTFRNFFQAKEDPTAVQIAKKWVVDKGPQGEFVTTLKEIDERKLQSGSPEVQPWSGDYWPDRIGGVAVRYAKVARGLGMLFGAGSATKKAERRNKRIRENFDELTTEEIAILSPTEKYDILLGDRNFSLTSQVTNGIEVMNKTFKGLPMWNGICNGWSPASFLLQRPRHAVAVQSVNGKTVTFYPDDMKALSSHLFARSFITADTYFYDAGKAAGEEKFSDQPMYGVRCNEKKPARDGNGSVLPLPEGRYVRAANECADDLNAGVWHLNIVNKTGVQKASFVVDRDYNSPVNNHPVAGYTYEYFNPITGKKGTSMESIVKKGDYSADPYASRRSKNVEYVIGVEMKVKLLKNVKARIKPSDSEADDKIGDWKITYDLELNEDQQIIGGEWRPTKGEPEYPDFMWYQRPWVWSTAEPQYGDEWETGKAPPAHWAQRSANGDPNLPYDRPTYVGQTNGIYAIYYNRGFGLIERADHPKLNGSPMRVEAYKLARQYINLCNEHCYDAYGKGIKEAQHKLGPLENMISTLHQEMTARGVPTALGSAYTRMAYGTLSQRAGDPALQNDDVKKRAKEVSHRYDALCAKYCAAAYQGKARDEAERQEALAKMNEISAELTRFQDYLDSFGVPMSAPYAQPIAKVVYKLIELANDKNVQQVYLPESSTDETPDGYGEEQ